jgi:hypothetical protein
MLLAEIVARATTTVAANNTDCMAVFFLIFFLVFNPYSCSKRDNITFAVAVSTDGRTGLLLSRVARYYDFRSSSSTTR